ncbi:MAG TPA: MDR family MFS transporter [Candidatus Dormibacteraeota bacterium]|jgi:EmrB/QacA subfamily drug resistance transporter|nr:MDR family MFS transporter [Candidatus Dormibacteraeota bacterium]
MPQAELTTRIKVLATIGVMLALLLAALDQTIVGTALPRIVAELNGLDRYSWLITGYLVASTVVVPIAGKLGDLFGRKPFLIAGMIGFVAASALCGVSQDMTQLIVFRVLQGLFGGMLFASAFTVLGDIYSPAERARIQGLFGAVFGLSSIIGPVVGGFLTDNLGWRWVFYVNLPVGLLGVLVVTAFLPFVRTKASWRDIDFIGSAALAGGLIPVLVALSVAKDQGWTSVQVLGLLGFGVAMLVAFFVIEQRVKEPIVPFSLFKNRAFTVSMVVGFFAALGMFGMIIFVPLELQGVLGVSVTNSGLLLTPMMLGLIVSSVLTGQLIPRIKHYHYLGTIGIALMMVGLYLMAQTTTATSQMSITIDIVLVGLGLGVTMPLYINAVQSALPMRYLGVGTSQFQFWRNVGGTAGAAILGTILAQRLPDAISSQIARVNLPPAFKNALGNSASNPNALLDPAKIAAAKAKLSPQLAPLFDQAMHAVRQALALTLHDLFLIAMALSAVALIATLFMPDVPLRSRQPQRGAGIGEVPATGEPEREAAVG